MKSPSNVWTSGDVKLYHGDCLDVMAEMEENSVDTIITDPPYGLEFMGKDWDKGVPGPRFWREALRVAKPGAMMLAFGGTRTWHRLACAIEDAGWELRDTMMYLYGSGFPKSRRLDLDASRCLPADAFCQCDANKHSISRTYPVRSVLDHIRKAGLSDATEHGALPSVLCDLDIPEDSLRDYQPCHHSDGGPLRQAAENVLTFALLLEYAQEHNRSDVLLDDRVAESLHSLYQVLCIDLPSMRDYLLPSYSESVSQLLRACEDGQSREGDLSNYVSRLAGSLDVQAWMDADISASRRPHIHSLVFCLPLSFSRMLCSPKADTIIPQSEWCANCGGIHNRWTGYGSSLKPAFEPIIVAMAPRDGTYAENAEKWGVAGLWIDGGRVETEDNYSYPNGAGGNSFSVGEMPDGKRTEPVESHPQGRWPANLILDGSDEVLAPFPTEGRSTKPSKSGRSTKNTGTSLTGMGGTDTNPSYSDSGSAARFFYCAKASRAERNAGLEGVEIVHVDLLEKGKESWDKEARRLRLLVDMVRSHVRVIGESTPEADTAWSTMLFGNGIMDLSPTDIVSTTSTKISSITESTILDSLISRLINASIAIARCETESGGNAAVNANECSMSLSFTNAKAASLPGVGNVASGTRWRISANEGNASESRPGALTNFHSTVKPIALLRYLCRLTKTPTGGTVLDPFMGSGSTGCAAVQEGRDFIGIELDADYCEISRLRIQYWQSQLTLDALL